MTGGAKGAAYGQGSDDDLRNRVLGYGLTAYSGSGPTRRAQSSALHLSLPSNVSVLHISCPDRAYKDIDIVRSAGVHSTEKINDRTARDGSLSSRTLD